MHILLADETNKQPSSAVLFFVYGGLLFTIDKLAVFDREIEKIRQEAGYQPEDEFKFDTRSRPKDVSFESSTKAKGEVLDLCKSMECKFIVNIILHEIIKKQNFERRAYWAADYVFGRYNKYLNNEVHDFGICIIDNIPTKTQYKYLREKFQKGLVFYTGKSLKLKKIIMFGTSCIGASHANSAMDIVLGSFRYCINNPKNTGAAKNMMGKVVDLLWHKRDGEKIEVLKRGLIIRPPIHKIEHEPHKRKYIELIDHINFLIKEH